MIKGEIKEQASKTYISFIFQVPFPVVFPPKAMVSPFFLRIQHGFTKDGIHAGLVTLTGALQSFNDICVKTNIYGLFYRFVICHVS